MDTDFLGIVALTPVGLQEAADRIAARDPMAPFAYVVTPNAAHVTSLSRPDSPYRAPYDGAWMRLCDSQAMRLLGRALFGQHIALAAGSDLTALLLRRVVRRDDAITVIGGSDRLAHELRAQFGLTRLAMHIPPMGYAGDPAEVARCIAFALAHPARLLFVITGAPRSERLLLEIAHTGQATGIGLAVGSSLAFATGLVPRAPAAFRRAGLEWLYRLGQNPGGHARRVFVESLPIVALAVRRRLRRNA